MDIKFNDKKIIIFLSIFFNTSTVSTFETTAKQAYLIDVLSGKVLLKRMKTKEFPASITKIMTTIVAFDLIKKGELKLNEKIRISKSMENVFKRILSMFVMLAIK